MQTIVCKHTPQAGVTTAAGAPTIGRRSQPSTRSRSLLPLVSLLLCIAIFLLCGALHPVRASSPFLLSSLSSSLETTASAPLVPSFSPNETSYTQSVPFGATTVTFRAVAAEPDNARIYATWNAQQEFAVQSGVTTPTLQLAADESYNELQITVVSSSPNNTYIVSIVRSLIVSNNANLISFQWRSDSGGVVDPSTIVSAMVPVNFSSQIFDYAVTLASGVSTLRFAGTIDALATLSYRTTRIQIGPPVVVLTPSASQSISSGEVSAFLSVGYQQRLRIQTTVLAEDKVTNKSYTFTLTRLEDAGLGTSSSSSGGAASGTTTSSSTGSSGSSSPSSSGSGGSAQSTGDSHGDATSRFSSITATALLVSAVAAALLASV